MRMFIFSLILLLFVSPVFAQEGTDWTNPETIDPYDPEVANFLQVEIDSLATKADQAYRLGNYEESAQYYLALLRYDAKNFSAMYNLACCYGLLDKPELAAKYLKYSVKAGFENWEHINWDPDFEKVRETDVFKSAMDSIEVWLTSDKKDLGKLIHVEAPSLLPCRVKIPADFDSTKACPLIIGLHGWGANPDGFIQLWDAFETQDFIYATPRAPYVSHPGKRVGYSWHQWDEADSLVGIMAQDLSEFYVTQAVMELQMRYNIGDVYLMGFSQGCGMTYTTGIQNYPLFKGLICFGGWLDTDRLSQEEIEAAKELKVYIVHGKEDRAVEFKAGEEANKILKEAGYDVKFHSFDGGHRVPKEALNAAYDWLLGE